MTILDKQLETVPEINIRTRKLRLGDERLATEFHLILLDV